MMRPASKEEAHMRMMLTAQIPTEGGNAAIRNGSLQNVIKKFMDEFKPEAAYFTAHHGDRCAYFVFDLKDASQIPHVAENFFLGLNAKVELRPCMNAQDLGAAGPHIEKWVKEYPKPIA
jgi:hypothetical protein